ncbi:MAG TPA: GAF domain-containing protein [Pyrinomonadaceae bacterium]|jgi:GAF domain-containing protein|nr:GAF domain-containing protein [Pyrinomonadaceae bacterium]
MSAKVAKKKTAATKQSSKKRRPKKKKSAKSESYANLVAQLRSLLKDEYNFIANTANFSSLVYNALPDVNWAGFYLLQDHELILGPFQGKPACVRIPVGKGVCGFAAKQCETVIVPDVNEFPGHIACDPESKSEIVIPLFDGERVLGVLDVDSTSLARFDDQDAEGLNELVTVLVAHEEGLDE